MQTQFLTDQNGKPTGVFIPIENWNKITLQYPNIQQIDEELPTWLQVILDKRLENLNDSNYIKPIDDLFNILDENL